MEPRWAKGLANQYVSYNEVLFHIFYYDWGEENVRYTEVLRYIEVRYIEFRYVEVRYIEIRYIEVRYIEARLSRFVISRFVISSFVISRFCCRWNVFIWSSAVVHSD